MRVYVYACATQEEEHHPETLRKYQVVIKCIFIHLITTVSGFHDPKNTGKVANSPRFWVELEHENEYIHDATRLRIL
jgi:hypothetical protein